jgi:hypothetical protein
MAMSFVYGLRQRFRFRTRDINILGRFHGATPVRRAEWRLNGGSPTQFYVEATPNVSLLPTPTGFVATPIDWRYQYKLSPAALRLWQLGDFNIEIATATPDLHAGDNQLVVEIEDRWKEIHRATLAFEWDPTPVALPVDLTDLSDFDHIQDIGQTADGAFELDRERNVIRSQTPVAPDNLLVVGPPAAAQEATYRIRFHGITAGKYVGLSDYFVGHEDNETPLGIKPGWSTAGMATVKSNGEARSWIAWGDNSDNPNVWLAVTEPAAHFRPAGEIDYRVRHQLRIEGGVTSTRFRIWREDEDEPPDWLCAEDDSGVEQTLPRHTAASFSLFQHTGVGSEWSDIRVVALD